VHLESFIDFSFQPRLERDANFDASDMSVYLNILLDLILGPLRLLNRGWAVEDYLFQAGHEHGPAHIVGTKAWTCSVTVQLEDPYLV
jgi:hypothetical protein